MSIFPLFAAVAPPRMRRVAFVGALIAALVTDPAERLKKAAMVNNERHVADDLHAFDIGFSQTANLGISQELVDRHRKDRCARLLDFASHRRALMYRLDVMEGDIQAIFKICT